MTAWGQRATNPLHSLGLVLLRLRTCVAGKIIFSLCASSALLRAPNLVGAIWAPETTTSVLATAGARAVLGSGGVTDAADAPEVGVPAIKPPVAGVGEGQFIGGVGAVWFPLLYPEASILF